MRQSKNSTASTENPGAKSTRKTWQKEAVYNVFSAMRNHPTAEMVCDSVYRTYPTIGRATVYRILNSFVDSGKAIKVPVCDGADRFDITTYPHSHAKCRVCGNVFDIDADFDMPEVRDSCGFTVENVAVLYFGICCECNKKEKENTI